MDELKLVKNAISLYEKANDYMFSSDNLKSRYNSDVDHRDFMVQILLEYGFYPSQINRALNKVHPFTTNSVARFHRYYSVDKHYRFRYGVALNKFRIQLNNEISVSI